MKPLKRFLVQLLLYASTAHAVWAEDVASHVDLLLKDGLIHTGDGAPPQIGSVAVVKDQIVGVGGSVPINAVRVIDCRGMMICPGFIDLHNHSDESVLQPQTRAAMNYVTQGCTTIVTGNCGMGPVDVGRYYDRIEEQGAGLNVAHLISQGDLRREVVGMNPGRPTVLQMDEMLTRAKRAMSEGAWGMSTGLIYVPSSYADTDELVHIAAAVGQAGGIYVSHIRNENAELLAAVEEALEIGRRAALPIHISHFKSTGKNSWGLVRVAIKIVEKAQAAGIKVTADQYPYTASSTSLQATLIPTWARAGGREAMIARFNDPDEQKRIFGAMDETLALLDGGQRLQIAAYDPNPSWGGERLSVLAEQMQVTPRELALQMIRNGGASIVNHSINEEDVRYVMQRDWVATASDGGAKLPGPTVPHPRSYGTFPRKIGHYAIREGVISVSRAIRAASGLPADVLGMSDRGYLRTGMMADIVVLDPQRIIDKSTFAQPHQYSAGIVHVFVNGIPVIHDHVPTGALAGRALRKAVAEQP